MKASRTILCALCSFTLPLSANALLVTPSVDVYGTNGFYNAGVFYGTSQDQVVLDNHDPSNPPGPGDIGLGTAYSDELRVEYSTSYTDYWGTTASVSQNASSNLQFYSNMVQNSGGQAVFWGDASALAGAVEHGGCHYEGSFPYCNYMGPAQASAASQYQFYFTLLTPHAFSYTATTDGGSDTYLQFYSQGFGDISYLIGRDSVGVTGVLQPGDYFIAGLAQANAVIQLMHGYTDGSAGQSAYFDYYLTLTPTAVPVPAAAWLFGSGLLGLVGVARRKRLA